MTLLDGRWEGKGVVGVLSGASLATVSTGHKTTHIIFFGQPDLKVKVESGRKRTRRRKYLKEDEELSEEEKITKNKKD